MKASQYSQYENNGGKMLITTKERLEQVFKDLEEKQHEKDS